MTICCGKATAALQLLWGGGGAYRHSAGVFFSRWGGVGVCHSKMYIVGVRRFFFCQDFAARMLLKKVCPSGHYRHRRRSYTALRASHCCCHTARPGRCCGWDVSSNG